jgi:hypothetical protein
MEFISESIKRYSLLLIYIPSGEGIAGNLKNLIALVHFQLTDWDFELTDQRVG